MSDLKEKIHAKMTDHTLASFATVTEDGAPWVRYVVIKADAQLNIWLATFKNSRKIKHIVKNPEVHLVLGATDMAAASWLQIQGRAAILEDAETKKAVWYDMLEPVFKSPEDPNLVVCKVTPYRIEYYAMNKPSPEVWKAQGGSS